MGICFKCGLEKGRLFDTVGEEGIISICEDCSDNEEVPIVKKPFEEAFEINNKKSVYERLSSVAGVDLDKHRRFEDRIEEKELQETELKEIVDKKFKDSLSKPLDLENDLVRNFHWIIMRARRLRKLTLSELAREIKESEDILKIIEKGIIPEGGFEIIRKLEIYFEIRIIVEEARKKINISEKKIGFDPISTRVLTIDDLREMKKKKEEEVFDEPEIEIKEDISEDLIQKEELSQKDIDDLIFGRHHGRTPKNL